jgi:hypothetical protein
MNQMGIFIFWVGPNAFKYIYIYLIPKNIFFFFLRIWGVGQGHPLSPLEPTSVANVVIT